MIEPLLGRLAAQEFTPPSVTAESPPVVLHQAILAHAALGNVTATRDCIARAWQAMNYLEIGDAERDNMLWDVAVREAQTWASEGHLDYALTDLEAWRHCAPIQQRPGHFEMRAMGVCLAAGDNCYDIVEQGVGTTAKLASSLRAAKYWYFWWD